VGQALTTFIAQYSMNVLTKQPNVLRPGSANQISHLYELERLLLNVAIIQQWFDKLT